MQWMTDSRNQPLAPPAVSPNDEPNSARARGVALKTSIHEYGASTANVATQTRVAMRPLIRFPGTHRRDTPRSRFNSSKFGIERVSFASWLAWLGGHIGR